ncbi:serpin (serine protease inhibitor) domain-containing protein [Phthorimaea operculella]|nr:serpin (serine protease inhibitor) domain-containing protein [Phthorimaea operculella]
MSRHNLLPNPTVRISYRIGQYYRLSASTSIYFLLFLLLQVSSSDNMDAKAVASSIANFSAKFCNELSKQTSVVSSPLSAEYLLALIALGADEPSHSELLTALGFPNKDSVSADYRKQTSVVSSPLSAEADKPSHSELLTAPGFPNKDSVSADYARQTSVVSSLLSTEYLLALIALGADEPSHSELLTAPGFPKKDSAKQTSVVSSPLSAEYLLALIALGADEPSHSELLTALGFPNKDSAKQTRMLSSPLSAEYLLALIALGADEPSHSELLTALGFPNKDSIRSGFSSVSSKLRSLKGVTLNVANRVYVKEGPYQLEPGLLKDATNVFDAVIEKMDFSQSAAAANTINQWVEKQTNNKIKDLLSPDCFNDLTRLVLVNALYFKGTWKSQFNPHHTRPEDFHVDANTKVQVPMMFKKDDFKYGESDALGVQLLEMNYEGDQASMVIILPREIEGLNGVLQKLADGYDLMAELDKMFKTKVEVSLPKFKIETEIDLNELLPKIGIKSIFDQSNSGLNNLLSPPEALFVSKAIQKAFIEVNEEGAEAAAATAMVVGFYSAMVELDPPKSFVADRPFVVAIYVDKTPFFFAKYHGAADK